MARFMGTTKEFKFYIGPLLRNVVQLIARKQKVAIGACEYCGADGELEAAHVHGRDRTDIINLILGTSEPSASVDVDLDEFVQKFRREHNPIKNPFLFLCATCHRKYDAAPKPPVVVSSTVSAPIETDRRHYTSHDILPISLDPARPDDFKARFLEVGAAVVEVLYEDGSVNCKPWNVSRLEEASDLFGNLRSRPEFRKGVWQESGIVKVNVRVAE